MIVMVGVGQLVVVFVLNCVTQLLVVTFVIMDVAVVVVSSLVIKLVGVGVVGIEELNVEKSLPICILMIHVTILQEKVIK